MQMNRTALWGFMLAIALAAVIAVPASAEVAVGDKAPDFQFNGLDGKAVKLSTYTDKPTLLVFWVSWCPHCQAELPVLQKVYSDLKGKGMNAVGVSVDQEEDDAKQFVKDYSLTFRNAFAFGSDNAMEVLDTYGVRGVPTIYIINKDGNVAWKYVGEAPEETVRAEMAKVGVK